MFLLSDYLTTIKPGAEAKFIVAVTLLEVTGNELESIFNSSN